DLRWQSFSYLFRATGPTTTLTLTDATGLSDVGGLVLDGLSVTPADGSSPLDTTAAPAALAAIAASPAQVNLSWTDNSDNESGFEVQRKSTGDWTKIGVAPANSPAFADSALGGGTHFSYRVRALGPNGASDWSNEASVDVPAIAGVSLDGNA